MRAVKRLVISPKTGRWLRLAGAFLACLILAIYAPQATAQSPAAPEATPDLPAGVVNRELIVGVSPVPPFTIKFDSAQGTSDWDGIGVHLWQKLAYNLDLNYQWRELTPEEAVEQLEAGAIDVALLTATAPRSGRVDFTQTYFFATLGIATQTQQRLWNVVSAILSPQFLRICFWLSIIFVFIGLFVWLFEHRSNADMFRKSPIKGIWDGFWWAGVTMTTIGYGDKAPKTVAGRILAMLWMLVAMGLTASLTASITSVLVLDQGVQTLRMEQLASMQVGSITNTTIAGYLEQEQVEFRPFQTPEAGLDAVSAGEIDAFVYSTVALQSLNQEDFQQRFQIEDTGIQVSPYAFAVRQNSPLRQILNQQILQELSEPSWQATLKRYLPE